MLTRKPKGPTSRRRASKKRQDDAVAARIRAQVSERDGYCLFVSPDFVELLGACSGPSEWAHIGKMRRCHTRGKPPEERHTTGWTAKMCHKHHADYDAHKFDIRIPEELADQGIDGSFVVVVG